MSRKKKTNKATGDELEQRVALYYEAMGYKVARDVLLAGHQIDLLASRYLPGVGDMRIAIEVKSRIRKLGVNDLDGPRETAKHLLDIDAVSTVILVTDAVVTRNARLALESQTRLRLATIKDLEHHLFNNAEALLRAVNDYETKPIFQSYYPLAAVAADRTTYSDAAGYIRSWARSNSGLLLLIGDFGTGKSTLLERVFYSAARTRIDNNRALFPVLVRLRGLRRFTELWHFVEASLRDTQYISPPRLVFEHELEQGRLLLLLDGFDEIYSGATAQERASYLEFLRPLLKSKSPVVLSSRPTFFNSFEDLMASIHRLNPREDRIVRLPDFGIDMNKIARAFGADVDRSLRRRDFAKVLEIKQLDKAQLQQVIAQRAGIIRENIGMSPKQFESVLYSIYDLEDLMTRPLLLDMILGTIATGAIDIKNAETVTASTLYDVYTQQAAIRDKKRAINDQLLTPELRLEACRELARTMFKKGDILLTGEEVEEVVYATLRGSGAAWYALGSEWDITRAVTDIRTCSFLRFGDDNSLVFTHKSFYEFFVAQVFFLASRDTVGAFLSLPRERLNSAIMYFLASFVRDQPSFAAFIKSRLRERLGTANRSFLYSLAFASGSVLEGSELTGGTVRGVELTKANVKSASAWQLNITETNMRKVHCENWTFKDVTLHGCEFREVQFDDCNWQITCNGSVFDHSNFNRSTFRFSGRNLSLLDVFLDDCSISLNCEVVLAGCTLSGGMIEFGSHASVHSDRSTAHRTTFSSTTEEIWYRPGCRFEFNDCTLSGLAFSGLDVFKSRHTRGERRIGLNGCKGIIYLETTAELENEGILPAILRDNPELFVIQKRLVLALRKFIDDTEVARAANRVARKDAPKQYVKMTAQLRGLHAELKEHSTKWNNDPTTLPRLIKTFISKPITPG